MQNNAANDSGKDAADKTTEIGLCELVKPEGFCMTQLRGNTEDHAATG